MLNSKRYVGSSVNLDKRFKEHLYDLKADRHCNKHLQRAWNKYGEDHFIFSVLEICEPIKDTLLLIEQKYLDLKPEYNICKIAGSNLGVKYPREIYRKRSESISAANSRRVIKDSTRLKHSENSKKSEWNAKLRKPVLMLCKISGELLKEFDSITAAALYTGHANHRINIRRVIRGEQKKAYGYFWKLKN